MPASTAARIKPRRMISPIEMIRPKSPDGCTALRRDSAVAQLWRERDSTQCVVPDGNHELVNCAKLWRRRHIGAKLTRAIAERGDGDEDWADPNGIGGTHRRSPREPEELSEQAAADSRRGRRGFECRSDRRAGERVGRADRAPGSLAAKVTVEDRGSFLGRTVKRYQPRSLGEVSNGVGVEERIERLGRPADRRNSVAGVQSSTLRRPSTMRASRSASRKATFHRPITG